MKVLLTGGGTGGHIYPALAVARRLQEMETDVELLYVGTSRGLESSIVPKEGIPFKAIEIEGFKRQFSFSGLKYNLKSVGLFLKSINAAKKIIREFNPDVVLGTGGYVSAPICYVASKQGIATVVHEQNSFLGLTNKFLIRYIDRLAISFQDIYEQVGEYKNKVVFTGNPRAQEVNSADLPMVDHIYGLDITKPIALIFGGSRGAPKINQAVVEAYPILRTRDYQIIFVPGNRHYEKVHNELEAISPLEQNPHFVVKPYIDDMIDVLRNVSLIVSRSGATTIAEITVLGIPSVLIPSPNVTEDHQTKNAMSLVHNEAAILLKEENLNGETLLNTLDELMNHADRRGFMSQRARELGEPYATDQLIQVMLDEMKKKK
ncbi:MAG TPA: undecaprenyldiphospho-muramoylpentapeptide beta-N-acetylglucosaminyltransferase [Atopostipes sp.]|nr:undecaprenyldiphospho-muramoylpentapeptide beta-N-acetylglucosaminyltransferase [Atopostipes sp.]